MCSNSTFKILSSLIEDRIQNDMPFTAFNISIAAKQQGATESHNTMKQAIHSIMGAYLSGGEYDRQMVQVGPLAYQTAWIYFPANTVPDASDVAIAPKSNVSVPSLPAKRVHATAQFKSRSRSAKTATATSTPIATTSSSVSGTVRSAGHDGRLLVPKQITNKLGVTPGSDVYAFTANPGTLLVRATAPTSHKYSTYFVDNHGNFRISPSRLKDAGLQNTSKFRLDVNNGSIVVRKG